VTAASREELTDDEFLILFNRNPMYGRYMYIGDGAEYASIVLNLIANPLRTR